jgi:hypothetical protein
VHEETQLLERRELAPNGRGLDLQPGSLDKRARRHRLTARDVAFDDSPQDGPLPLRELGFDVASGHFAGILGEKLRGHAAAEEAAALREREHIAGLAALNQA